MRLTLRYLLAFMDGNLGPEDTQEIGKKIEESETANGLLNRIRDVMRRLRLGAPSVSERGPWLDPNTVAEYLDHRLADGRVPDFEKVCFESDVQLAEVASCHEILSAVLRDPVEIDPDSRERMYQVANLVEGEANSHDEGAAAATASSASPNGNAHPAAEADERAVPDYLRESARRARRWRIAILTAVVLAIVVALLAIAGQFDPGTLLGNLFNRTADESQLAQGTDRQKTGSPAETARGEAGETKGPVLRPSLEKPAKPADPQAAGTPPVAAPEKPGPEAMPPKPEVGPKGPSDAVKPPVEPAAGAEPQPPGSNPPLPPPRTQPPAPKPPALPPERVGVFVSPKEVILTQDPRSGSWRRLAEQTVVTSQDRLLSLPTFRPALTLAGRIHLQLIDGAAVQFLPAGQQGVPGLVVEFGRLVLKPEEGGQAKLRLQVGERIGMVAFGDGESTLAIDVGRSEGTGDPETQPGALVADLYATTGKIVWQDEPDGKPIPLTAPIRGTLSEHALDTVAQQFPRWVFDTSLGSLDQRASAAVERELLAERPERPIYISLRELVERRQKEVRWLAMRNLALVGDYEPLLAVLNDPDQRLVWVDYIEQLRAAVARSPQSAAQVRSAMEKIHGDQGAGLYSMLWKYRADGISPGDARQLVKYLDHETLIFRVLSSWNLKNITGLTYGYKPWDIPSRRQPAIQKWKDRLASMPTLRPQSPAGEEKPSQEPAPREGARPEAAPAEPKELPPAPRK